VSPIRRLAGITHHSEENTMLNRSMTNTLDRMLTLNRALDEAFTTSMQGAEASRVWVPAIDLIEKKDSYVVRAELPGVDRADIEITFEKNILTISGQKSALLEGKDEEIRVFAAERVSGSFSRSLRMPEYIDGDRIAAEHKDGVLTITIPKAELAQPRKIEVK
jgi:HSP20 family protein